MAKRSGVRFPGFVLRSGYVVDFDPNNVPGMLDHLRNAIVGESLEVLRRKRKKNWMMAANQILAEIQHLATTTPHDIAQGLLVALLAEGAFDKLRKVAEEHQIQAPPITDKIQ